MNILEILESSILLEAVRISKPEDAYELIKSKKLGVKMHPSYNNVDDKYKEWDIELGVRNIINSVDSNNIVYAVQLFVNKVPTDQLRKVTSNYTIVNLVDYRNKPWTKQIPEYKEFIELNSKPINIDDLTDLSVMIKREAQRHGHGDKKDAKELYNDGTWTLQVPTSFKGEKAISFYGKKGEQQIPTEWCTRADEYTYNTYTYNNTRPLYVIRNWKTGKSYQMAINGKRVDFLDEKDVRGDEITNGDLTPIPDDLLNKIKYNDKETMLDFKKAISEINKKINKDISSEEVKNLKKRGYFDDATLDLENARWSSPIKVNDKISKRIFLNYGIPKEDQYINPMKKTSGSMNPSYLPDSINDWKDKTLKTVKGKAAEYTKHNGKYAAIYYCNDTSEVGIMIKLSRNGENYYKPTSFTAIGVKKVNGKYEKTSTSYVQDNCSDYTNLLEVSRKDVGAYKAILRSNKKDADNESVEESRKYIQDILHLYATRYLWPIIIKKIEPKLGYNNSITLDINIPGTFFVGGIQGRGGILPGLIRGYIIKNGRRTDYNFEIAREKDSSKYNIEFFKDNELTKELNKVVDKMMSEYIRTIIKDKKLKNMRINDREGKDTKNRLQFENYFPY